MGEIDAVTQRIFDRARASCRRLTRTVFRDRGIEIKTPEQIERMRAAGLVVGETLELLRHAAAPGVTTGELDAIAEDHIRSSGAVPSFKGYSHPPFPASICASVNDEIVHGIPGDRVLRDGDIISIDCGAIVDGWHGDAAITVAVGEVSDEARELMRRHRGGAVARARRGPARRPGQRHLPRGRDATSAARGRFGIVEDYVGHGIGSAMHQPPNVPNHGRPGRGPRLVRGSRSPSSLWWSPATRTTRCSTTSGRWPRATARWQRTTSTRSR